MIAIGQTVPDLELVDTDGTKRRLIDQRGRVVIINFWSAECPWAERADQQILDSRLEWGDQVVWWSIASNGNESQGLINKVASERHLPVVLCDPKNWIADLFGATTTPHLYIIDQEGILRYHGAPDDVTFRQRTPTRFYLKEVLQALLNERLPEIAVVPPYGCVIVRYADDRDE